jgi:Glycosyltransferase sugar-binding region containing DXD motif
MFMKADLFRYLVLLREGGVYADVDVMLETDLDNFILAGMTFFAPRDVPCEYAGEAFCLWNGIVGSTPGHPILVRAVERLVNLIQDRADTYDMEREVCLHEGSNLPLWKIRAQPLLFLSGPCGLGLAMNEALGRSSLESLPVGYVRDTNRDQSNDYGDAFVLIGDKYDLGQFRISDSDRNIIFASTDVPNVSSAARAPLHATNADKHRQSRIGQHRTEHYSLSKKGTKIWGTSNVYINDLASDYAIRLNIKHTSEMSLHG